MCVYVCVWEGVEKKKKGKELRKFVERRSGKGKYSVEIKYRDNIGKIEAADMDENERKDTSSCGVGS